jgi:hypothetical protein
MPPYNLPKEADAGCERWCRSLPPSLTSNREGGENMSFNVSLLREIRAKHGIERSDFARLLGISEDYLYRS